MTANGRGFSVGAGGPRSHVYRDRHESLLRYPIDIFGNLETETIVNDLIAPRKSQGFCFRRLLVTRGTGRPTFSGDTPSREECA